MLEEISNNYNSIVKNASYCPATINAYKSVVEALQAFNPNSDKKSDISYDFHKYFDNFYADEYKYVIEESNTSN